MKVKILKNYFSAYDIKAVHPLQSWLWGEARKKMGIEVLRLGEYQQNKLKNVFQLTFHRIPLTNYKIGYLPRSVFPSNTVLEFLDDYGKKNKVIFIKIEPYVEKSQFSISNFQTNFNFPKTNFQFLKSKHPLFPDWTQIIDLTKSEEELLKNMHPKTRYNIRLAQKKGVVVKEMSDNKGFEIFSKLYFKTCQRQKYFGHTKKYHEIIWNSLKKNIAHILVAFYKDIPLAAYELFYFNNRFYYPYGGSSDDYRNLMATNLIMWQAVKFGKKIGAKKFDMWGSLPPNYNSKNPWAGFTRFKKGYGGSFVRMTGSFDLLIKPRYYTIYNLFYLIRQFYLKLKKNSLTLFF